MNCSWFFKASETVENVAHTHDSDEIIGFFGSNPQSPYDLCGEIEIWLEDENYILTRSCLIFIPAGMKHCPLIIMRVDRPIFHFTVVIAGTQVLRTLKRNQLSSTVQSVQLLANRAYLEMQRRGTRTISTSPTSAARLGFTATGKAKNST